MLKWGEALHGYDVSLAEGSYTVVVNVTADDPTQVMTASMRDDDNGAACRGGDYLIKLLSLLFMFLSLLLCLSLFILSQYFIIEMMMMMMMMIAAAVDVMVIETKRLLFSFIISQTFAA